MTINRANFVYQTTTEIDPSHTKFYNNLCHIPMESIRSLVADKPVVLFSKSSCCMSHSIQTLISGFGAKMTVYEVDQLSNGKEIEKALVQMGCKPSVPAVFIGEQLIGGANQVMTLQVKNQLAALLRRAGAIWV